MRRILFALAAASLAAPLSGQIAPPDPGLLLSYHYWPEQFVQFVGPELPYSMITVEVMPGKKPVVAVTLTGRSDHNRILYSDNPAVVAGAKAEGIEAHQTALAWEEADTQTTGAASTLRLTMVDGKPLEWRFVQGSDISGQGAGLTALAESLIPVLAYREEAAVAGEGTALKIGDTVSAADVWKEISQPPYFVAYHGALSLGAHTLVLPAGREHSTVVSPATLTPGATWQFTGEGGQTRTLKVTKVDGPHYTMDLAGSASTHTTVLATRTGDTWQVDALRCAPVRDGDKHSMTVSLTPTALAVAVNKGKPIATAALTRTGDTTTVTMQTPTWAKGKTLTETSTVSATEQTTTAHP